MARKKQILVKDLLQLMEEQEKVNIVFYAYGVYYGQSNNDGMQIVQDCMKELNYDCINAIAFKITSFSDHVIIHAEIVH